MRQPKPKNITPQEAAALSLFMAQAERLSLDATKAARKATRKNGRDKVRRYRGELRAQVAERDNCTCSYCGAEAPRGHVDHVIPWALGGLTSLENAAWACVSCNLKKGKRVW